MWSDISNEEEEATAEIQSVEPKQAEPKLVEQSAQVETILPENAEKLTPVWFVFSDDWTYDGPFNYCDYIRKPSVKKLKKWAKEKRYQWFHAYDPVNVAIITHQTTVPAPLKYLNRIHQSIPDTIKQRFYNYFPADVVCKPQSTKATVKKKTNTLATNASLSSNTSDTVSSTNRFSILDIED